MTTAPANVAWTPHPLARIYPGDVIDTWCHCHGRLVPHLYQPSKTPPLVCLICHPELDPVPQQGEDGQG
jgi:hypothetical protein